MNDLYKSGDGEVPEIPDDRFGLTKQELDTVISNMQDGMAGFLKRWGLHQYGQAVCAALSDKDLSQVCKPGEVQDVETKLLTLAGLTQHLVLLVMRRDMEPEPNGLAASTWDYMHKQGLLRPVKAVWPAVADKAAVSKANN